MTPGTLLLRMANALSVRIALPSLSQRMASMMSNPPDLPVTRPPAYPWTEWPTYPSTTSSLPHLVLEPSLISSPLSWSCRYMFPSSGPSVPRLSCTPSHDLASNALQTIRQTQRPSFALDASHMKATHSWVNGTATCMIQTNHVPPVSVFAVCSGRVGSTSSSGRRQFTVILHRHMCPSQHDRTVSECKRSLYS
jgi:hypothetical protein